jgi:hypothetical protein
MKGVDMSNNWKTVITTASVVAALAGGSALHAQTTAPAKPQDGGTMMQGQHGDMMNMMTQMNKMMENCNKMMEGMNMGDRPRTPKDPKSPEKQS